VKRGFTLFEIIVYVGLFLLLAGGIVLLVDPPEIEGRLKDGRRMADMGILSQAITAYKIDNKTLPDVGAVSPAFRQSHVLPSGQTNLNNAVSGWIVTDLSKYIQKLPVDPTNDSVYFYRYTHNANSFEIDCVLQVETAKMQNDGGNNVNRYEVGTDLSLL
jgi:type II secretory pathway pseudopilin PulG